MSRKKLSKRSQRMSIQARISFVLVLVTITVMAAFVVYNYMSTRSKMASELNESAEIAVNRLSKTLITPLWNFEVDGANELLVSEMMDKDVYGIIVKDKDGKIYAGKKRSSDWDIIPAESDIAGDYVQKEKEVVKDKELLGTVKIFYAQKFMRDALHQSTWNIILTAILLNIALLAALYFAIKGYVINPINGVITGLSRATDDISFASEKISVDSQEMADRTSKQAASLQQSSSSMEEMSAMIRQNASNAKRANALAGEAEEAVRSGNAKMQQMEEAISDVDSSSNKTSKIIKTIDEIAFQTNLLALNAAVEAARAGEAGQGFAVVADEVRSLSQRAADAAQETSDLIEGSLQHTKRSVAIAEEVAEALKTIDKQIHEMNVLVEEISAASDEQSRGIDQLNSGIGEIDQVTQSNAASAEDSAATSVKLNRMAHDLQSSVHALLKLTGKKQQNGIQRERSSATAKQTIDRPNNEKSSYQNGNGNVSKQKQTSDEIDLEEMF